MGLAPGAVIAGTSYQVVREIGAGGMGIVYEVEHVRLRKRYVAKVIHEQIRGDADAPKRMEREAQVLAEINHPNVVQVHDVGVTPDGTSYFVMEKLEGMDLRHAMKEGRLSSARAVGICVDILDALDHVHRRGIVHRDVKPENVFLAQMPTGAVTKVLDFGVVHIFDGERTSQARITKTGGFVGTLYYAAPEQMQGLSVGPPNDVYACGLVLYELLAGHGPFDNDPGVGLSRCFKPAPRLPLNERVNAALADAVAASLEQDPAKRPTAGVLARRLRQTLTTLPTDPGPAPSPRRTVENLLGNVETAAPATPLMAGAPVAYAATVASAGAAPPGPNVDTSSGVASSIEPFAGKPRTPLAVLIGAPIAALAVIGLIATAGITALRRSSASAPNAASAVSAPPPAASAVPELAPEHVVEPTPVASSEPTPEPAISASVAKPSLPNPTPATRPAAKPRGHAEKDGYMKAEDL